MPILIFESAGQDGETVSEHIFGIPVLHFLLIYLFTIIIIYHYQSGSTEYVYLLVMRSFNTELGCTIPFTLIKSDSGVSDVIVRAEEKRRQTLQVRKTRRNVEQRERERVLSLSTWLCN